MSSVLSKHDAIFNTFDSVVSTRVEVISTDLFDALQITDHNQQKIIFSILQLTIFKVLTVIT